MIKDLYETTAIEFLCDITEMMEDSEVESYITISYVDRDGWPRVMKLEQYGNNYDSDLTH